MPKKSALTQQEQDAMRKAVKTSALVLIEVEDGCVSSVQSSHRGLMVCVFDRDAQDDDDNDNTEARRHAALALIKKETGAPAIEAW